MSMVTFLLVRRLTAPPVPVPRVPRAVRRDARGAARYRA